MPSPNYDLCAIGNALVDIMISTEDAFLSANGIQKGTMALIDNDRASALYQKAGAAAELSSGGSAANTLTGFASLGGRGAYLGKVGKDKFGDVFTNDMRAQNIHFLSSPSSQLSTGRCLVLVTPDAQRSMNTFLGAAVEFGPDDVDQSIVENATITYLEGYLFDKPLAQEAFRKAARIAHGADRKLSLTLSDVFCVSRHRAAFLDLVRGEVDILFGNEKELMELYQTQDLKTALENVRKHVEIAVITLGAKGAIIATNKENYDVPAHPVSPVVDTTGAGDLYAAGFLFGYSQNKSLQESGRIGAIAAAEVISHYGPRPQKKLRDLI